MERQAIISRVMMPNQTNPSGNIYGGDIMKMMDAAAYAAARKYARSNVVTARVDELQFHLSIKIGDLVTCTGTLVFVGNSSMEVQVRVEVEDLDEDVPPQHALSAFFTMVALDRNGRPKKIPPMELETEEERIAFEAGRLRHESYRKRKQEAQAKKVAEA